jgi:hypothetical protein
MDGYLRGDTDNLLMCRYDRLPPEQQDFDAASEQKKSHGSD